MVPMVYTKKFCIVRVKGPVHSFIHSFFTVVTLECALKLHLANIDHNERDEGNEVTQPVT